MITVAAIFTFWTMALGADPASPDPAPIVVENALVRVIEQVEIPALKEGLLLSVKVREGDVVKKGDLLAVIDDAQARLTLQHAEIELQLAREKAQSDVAVRTAQRVRDHSAAEFARADRARQSLRGSISDAEYERLRLDRDKTLLELERAVEERKLLDATRRSRETDVQLANLEVVQRQITAPLNSIVAQIYHPPGEWMQPGHQMFRVLQIDRLRVECYVSLDVAESLLPKMPVTLTPTSATAGKTEFRGEVVFVHPESDPVNGQVRVWAEIDNAGAKLRPGMRGRMRITRAPIRQAAFESR
jgi:multidrug efflux pump subunit AcrA (membrane-fusion protein)